MQLQWQNDRNTDRQITVRSKTQWLIQYHNQMDQMRQLDKDHEIINEIPSDRHPDTEITIAHQYNCLNRPNEPKGPQNSRICLWEEINDNYDGVKYVPLISYCKTCKQHRWVGNNERWWWEVMQILFAIQTIMTLPVQTIKSDQ